MKIDLDEALSSEDKEVISKAMTAKILESIKEMDAKDFLDLTNTSYLSEILSEKLADIVYAADFSPVEEAFNELLRKLLK